MPRRRRYGVSYRVPSPRMPRRYYRRFPRGAYRGRATTQGCLSELIFVLLMFGFWVWMMTGLLRGF